MGKEDFNPFQIYSSSYLNFV